MTDVYETMEKAYKRMDKRFPSKMFCRTIRMMGVHQSLIDQGVHKPYLMQRAIPEQNNRWWTKTNQFSETISAPEIEYSKSIISLEDAVKMCKAAGYKVMMPTYKEI